MLILETKLVGEEMQIFLSGSIYVDDATEIRETFTYLMNKGHKFFLVDLSQVDYIDCMGLGILIYIRNSLVNNDGDVKLTGVHGLFEKLVELTKMTNVFEIV